MNTTVFTVNPIDISDKSTLYVNLQSLGVYQTTGSFVRVGISPNPNVYKETYSSFYIGGICGNDNSNGETTIEKCYNRSTISVTSRNNRTYYNYELGGIVGTTTSYVSDCYNTGNISVSGNIPRVRLQMAAVAGLLVMMCHFKSF